MALDTRDESQSYQAIASRIMQLIAETGLKPGDRLPTERELGRELGVSRHTVSQAVKVLAVSGVLRSRQGSGIYVTRTSPPTASGFIDVTVRGDPQQVQQLCEFRMTLEMQTARLAAERITPRLLRRIEDAAFATKDSAERQEASQFSEADTEFHLGIAEATGNEYLASAVAAVIPRAILGWGHRSWESRAENQEAQSPPRPNTSRSFSTSAMETLMAAARSHAATYSILRGRAINWKCAGG